MTTPRGTSRFAKTQEVKKIRQADSKPVTFETVREMALALALDDVEEGTSYRTPEFRVRGGLFAPLREDPDSLVVRMEPEQREELMAAEPDTYYITEHYLNYPWMLGSFLVRFDFHGVRCKQWRKRYICRRREELEHCRWGELYQ
ncbi:MAG: MmcQ/YjbR family DNA-binding protein [Acidobacteriia bacterium]|nr:MmcQ/YjbR family DNA-binding protein [Terriglobia bacterium]